MTAAENESLMFYVINDAALINALLWGDFNNIDKLIDIINNDGMAVIKLALEKGPENFFSKNKDISIMKYELFKKRFKPFSKTFTKQDVIDRAYKDIENLQNLMQPLDNDMTLYRNVNPEFCEIYKNNQKINLLGFSSCSLEPHSAGNKQYGNNADCIMVKINVPASFPAIRVDLLENIRNELDEVILPPMTCSIDNIKNVDGKPQIEMTCLQPQYIDLNQLNKFSFVDNREHLQK